MFSRTFLTIAEHAVDWAALMPRDASVREDVVTAADQSPSTCKRRRDTGIVRQDRAQVQDAARGNPVKNQVLGIVAGSAGQVLPAGMVVQQTDTIVV